MKTELMRKLLKEALDGDLMTEIITEGEAANTETAKGYMRASLKAHVAAKQSDDFLSWDGTIGSLKISAEALGFETGFDFACHLLGEKPVFDALPDDTDWEEIIERAKIPLPLAQLREQEMTERLKQAPRTAKEQSRFEAEARAWRNEETPNHDD